MLLNPDSSMHSVEPPRVSKLKVFRVYSVSVKSVNTAHFKGRISIVRRRSHQWNIPFIICDLTSTDKEKVNLLYCRLELFHNYGNYNCYRTLQSTIVELLFCAHMACYSIWRRGRGRGNQDALSTDDRPSKLPKRQRGRLTQDTVLVVDRSRPGQ